MRNTDSSSPTSLPWSALALLLGLAPAHAMVYTVGAPSTGCTHTTIQAAIDAAQANPGGDTVRITRSQAYTGQQLFVNTDQDLNIVGGFATCTSTSSDGQKTVVSAAGPNNYSVFNVSNTNTSILKFRLLRLTGGRAPNGYGGGINYVGNGAVELIEMAIDTNRASYGGGIYFQGTANDATLTISNDNLINGNTANISGGGIYLQRATLTMTAPGSSLYNNTAVNYGGGLRLYGAVGVGTEATVGSSGYPGISAIDSNTARFGGGVAVQGLEDGGVGTADFTLQAGARIAFNFASERGGAIDLQNYYGVNDVGDARASSGGVLDTNIAPQASAVYVGHDTDALGFSRGSSFQMGGGGIVGNINADASNNATAGATLVVSEEGRLNVNRVLIQDNEGGAVLRADASDSNVIVSVDNSLISGNSVARSVFETLSGAPIVIRGSTFAGNTVGGAAVISTNGNLRLEQSIVWQPGKASASGTGARFVDDVLASELASLPASASIFYADPRFIDPARGDYHLQAASPAVDYSGVTGGSGLDGVTHDRDMALVANEFGAGDLGAYEVPAITNLVLNPGFLQDLRLWPVVTPNVSTWTAPGASGGPGSALVSYTRGDITQPPAGTLQGLSQCVHIPGPGTYRLTGFAYGEGAGLERDQPSLRWTLRTNPGGEACSGSATAEGIVPFSNASGFTATPAPAILNIPANQWTPFTNVEVRLAVIEGGIEVLATTTGHFDGIVLDASGPQDPLFSNGFE